MPFIHPPASTRIKYILASQSSGDGGEEDKPSDPKEVDGFIKKLNRRFGDYLQYLYLTAKRKSRELAP